MIFTKFNFYLWLTVTAATYLTSEAVTLLGKTAAPVVIAVLS